MSDSSDETTAIEVENARRALLRLDEAGRQAHFASDAAAYLAHDADPVIYVREGEVISMPHTDLLRIYAEDMKGASYLEWDYLEPPVVRIARDASLAWIITRRKVRRMKRQETGDPGEEEFIYAGVNMYEMRDGAWVRVANVSTFAEDQAEQ